MAKRAKDPYRLFRPTFTTAGADGQRQKGQSDVYSMAFRDHLARRQTLSLGESREAAAHQKAGKVLELIRARKAGEPVDVKLSDWVNAQPARFRDRLRDMGLVDVAKADASWPLLAHLEGQFDADGKALIVGYQQARESRGTAANSIPHGSSESGES